jgi:hypothetical protein
MLYLRNAFHSSASLYNPKGERFIRMVPVKRRGT